MGDQKVLYSLSLAFRNIIGTCVLGIPLQLDTFLLHFSNTHPLLSPNYNKPARHSLSIFPAIMAPLNHIAPTVTKRHVHGFSGVLSMFEQSSYSSGHSFQHGARRAMVTQPPAGGGYEISKGRVTLYHTALEPISLDGGLSSTFDLLSMDTHGS